MPGVEIDEQGGDTVELSRDGEADCEGLARERGREGGRTEELANEGDREVDAFVEDPAVDDGGSDEDDEGDCCSLALQQAH